MRALLSTISMCFLLAACGGSGKQASLEAESSLPRRQGFVSDFAEKLSPETKVKLEQTLKDFADGVGVELAVVTVPFDFLQGAAIEEYSLKLAKEWGIGRATDKLGLLLLVAIQPTDDAKVYTGGTRLEVSRKLERDIPDDVAKKIISKARGDFQAGRFDQGVTDAVTDIVATVTAKRTGAKSS